MSEMRWVVIAKLKNGDKIVDRFDTSRDAAAYVFKKTLYDPVLYDEMVMKITIERMWFDGRYKTGEADREEDCTI